MIKRLILGVCVLFTASVFAQEGTASPYSYYGLGDIKFKGTIETRSMGGIGVIADTVRLNLQNPASYSSLKYTIFSIGGTSEKSIFETNSQKEETRRTTMDYLAVGLPLGRVGISFGLMPYSFVGYKIRQDANEFDPKTYSFMGEGGLNRVFVGGSYKITPKLSIGADFQYNFGKVESETVAFYPDVILGSRARNTSRYKGISANFGMFYKTKLMNKYDWQSSLTFAPKSSLTSENDRNVAVVSYNLQGVEIISDQKDVEVPDQKYTLPSKLAFGTSFGKVKKWMVGAEYTLKGKNDNFRNENSNVAFNSASQFSIGGYYIPKYNSFSNYLQRMTYRAGFRYEDTGLEINNKKIADQTASIGFGFPVGTTISSFNLGLEYGKRGTKSNGLIQENHFGISIGLTFSDRWFVRTKYD